jgi:histidine phosphotransferase ChpT
MGMLPKNQVKLLLNLIALSINALPRGGSIAVTIGEDLSNFDFLITCTGRTARPPKYLAQIVAGEMPEIDAMSVQAYYTWRLAANVDATIAIEQDGDAVVITARRGM